MEGLKANPPAYENNQIAGKFKGSMFRDNYEYDRDDERVRRLGKIMSDHMDNSLAPFNYDTRAADLYFSVNPTVNDYLMENLK